MTITALDFEIAAMRRRETASLHDVLAASIARRRANLQRDAAVPSAALPPAAPVTESTAPATVTTPKVAASPLADLARLVAAQPAPPPARVRKTEVDGAEFILNAMRRCGAKV